MEDKISKSEAQVHDDEQMEQVFLAKRRSVEKVTRKLTQAPISWMDRKVNQGPDSAVVLELGCGRGNLSKNLGRRNSTWLIHATDISKARVREARKAASANVFAQVMSGEELAFKDEVFDIVIGAAILHHLDLEKALAEVHRVLKKGGRAVFLEPLGHNPLVNLYRRRTPEVRFATEHPLTTDDLHLMKSLFSKVDTTYFCLFSLLIIPPRFLADQLVRVETVDRIFKPFLSLANILDRLIFKLLPFCREYAWKVVIELVK